MMTIMNDTTTNQQQNQRGGGGSVVVEVIRIMIGIETIILHVVEEKLSFTKYQQQQQFPVTEVEVNRKVAQQASHTKSSKIQQIISSQSSSMSSPLILPSIPHKQLLPCSSIFLTTRKNGKEGSCGRTYWIRNNATQNSKRSTVAGQPSDENELLFLLLEVKIPSIYPCFLPGKRKEGSPVPNMMSQ
mmetsp:Transcript_1666/g.1777  ORF Transcript_1666/g.1777 Transcript_1666/m.1777 type:complete len:187 (+) Transcript_1666:486-1046(+)